MGFFLVTSLLLRAQSPVPLKEEKTVYTTNAMEKKV
jgi:hypothetical protein